MFVVAFGTNVPTPLLLVYRDDLGLSSNALTGAFAVYAAGLVPALLLAGPASDRFGRRPVVLPFVVLSVVTSLLFLGAGSSVVLLFVCRFLQGAVSGVVFSVGTAWLGELIGEPGRSARLTTAALGGGWALRPAAVRAAGAVGAGADRAALPGARGADARRDSRCCPRVPGDARRRPTAGPGR